MRAAIERHDSGGAVVIPISIRYCDWDDTPFSKIQGLPVDLTPISSFEGSQRDAAYAAVVKAIRQKVKAIAERKRRKHESDSKGVAPEVTVVARPPLPPDSTGAGRAQPPVPLPDACVGPGRSPVSEPPPELVSRPDWASDAGRDEFGPWVRIAVEPKGGGKPVTQRLRWIPPGRFLMGSPDSEPGRDNDEGPQHPVTLSRGFWLFDTACTQALWRAVMGNNPSHFTGSPDLPVETVSWTDVQDFLARINAGIPGLDLTLPTEAQWEYACRAGTATPFSFGATITPEQVNYDGNHPYAGSGKGVYRAKTVPVASLPANPWGLYEMHGNVWEWCLDGRRTYRVEAATDPTGPLESAGAVRALRGGSWGSDARGARAASRPGPLPVYRDFYFGFRCSRVQS